MTGAELLLRVFLFFPSPIATIPGVRPALNNEPSPLLVLGAVAALAVGWVVYYLLRNFPHCPRCRSRMRPPNAQGGP